MNKKALKIKSKGLLFLFCIKDIFSLNSFFFIDFRHKYFEYKASIYFLWKCNYTICTISKAAFSLSPNFIVEILKIPEE